MRWHHQEHHVWLETFRNSCKTLIQVKLETRIPDTFLWSCKLVWYEQNNNKKAYWCADCQNVTQARTTKGSWKSSHFISLAYLILHQTKKTILTVGNGSVQKTVWYTYGEAYRGATHGPSAGRNAIKRHTSISTNMQDRSTHLSEMCQKLYKKISPLWPQRKGTFGSQSCGRIETTYDLFSIYK